MKLIKCMILSLWVALTICMFNSCMNDEGYSLDDAWYSIATIRTEGYDTASYWLTLDSGTSLWPVATNVPWYNPKDKQRALVVYTILSDEYSGYNHAVKILDINGVLTKQIAGNLDEENDETYGTDPVQMSKMWIGDGYLNIIFEFNYGGGAVHFINLMENDSVNTPYFFEFRHNAYNDSERYRRKGIVSFDLSTVDTNGEEVELTIQVNTFDGTKDYKITHHSLKNEGNQNRNYSTNNYVEIK